MTRRLITHETVASGKIRQPLTLALVADLHNGPYADLLPTLRQADGILILGDLLNRHRDGFDRAAAFLKDAPACAPTFYALGNHERCSGDWEAFHPLVRKSRVTLLDNAFVSFGGIMLGGLSSPGYGRPASSFLRKMAARPGFKLLMCHHPELYASAVAPYDIDLTVSGHAHGGQVRLMGRGLYAPGQGLFPKLTSGWYFDRRLLVSRGLTNSAGVPRLFNPCELILLHLEPKER